MNNQIPRFLKILKDLFTDVQSSVTIVQLECSVSRKSHQVFPFIQYPFKQRVLDYTIDRHDVVGFYVFKSAINITVTAF